jgi:hypothetical protein
MKTEKALNIPSTCATSKTSECIRAKKIYDWVVLSSNEDDLLKVTDPKTVIEIEKCLHSGKSVEIKCEVVNKNPNCTAVIQQRGLVVNGSNQAACVKLMQSVDLLLTFWCDGKKLGSCIKGSILLKETTILCLPEPLNESNISCTVSTIVCEANGVTCNKECCVEILVSVDLCLEVHVETDVNLRVDAGFCKPRPPISMQEVYMSEVSSWWQAEMCEGGNCGA